MMENVVFNGIIIGALIALTATPDAFWQMFLISGLQVAAGELAVMAILGVPLFAYLKKSGLVRQLLGE